MKTVQLESQLQSMPAKSSLWPSQNSQPTFWSWPSRLFFNFETWLNLWCKRTCNCPGATSREILMQIRWDQSTLADNWQANFCHQVLPVERISILLLFSTYSISINSKCMQALREIQEDICEAWCRLCSSPAKVTLPRQAMEGSSDSANVRGNSFPRFPAFLWYFSGPYRLGRQIDCEYQFRPSHVLLESHWDSSAALAQGLCHGD